jgi:hypothetical protein
MQKQTQTQASQDSVDCERWEDPLGKALGGVEHRGRVRGVGNGSPWKVFLPEDKEIGRQRRRARSTARMHIEFNQRVAAVAEQVAAKTVRRMLAEQGHQPMLPNTNLSIPGDAHTQSNTSLSIPRGTHTQSPDIGGHISTNKSVLCIPAGSLNPIDSITVSMNKNVSTTIF